jgi:hypothetical protein
LPTYFVLEEEYRTCLSVSFRPPERPSALPLAFREFHLDLDYLQYRQQVSLMRAKQAAGKEARSAHYMFAQAYAERVLDIRRALAAAT